MSWRLKNRITKVGTGNWLKNAQTFAWQDYWKYGKIMAMKMETLTKKLDKTMDKSLYEIKWNEMYIQ